MQLLMLIFILVAIALLAFIAWQLLGVEQRLNKRLDFIEVLLKARVGNVVNRRQSHQDPKVDSKARTTKRDTNDIPARGARMSTAVHRIRSDKIGDADDRKL